MAGRREYPSGKKPSPAPMLRRQSSPVKRENSYSPPMERNSSRLSSVQRENSCSPPMERNSSRSSSAEVIRKCADCKNPPHVQCLHCSKQVCMDCAQKHVSLATQQLDVARHSFNDKLGILDRLSAAAKAQIKTEHNNIIKQADTERDQAFVQIDQLLEQQKKQIRDKNTQLSQLPLDKIPSYIQRMTREMDYINEQNKQLFRVTCTPPKIQVQHKHQHERTDKN